MNHHELTFSRAVAMTTAAIAAGQLNYADHTKLTVAIASIYDTLKYTEFAIISKVSAYPVSCNTLAEGHQIESKTTTITQPSNCLYSVLDILHKLLVFATFLYLKIHGL